MHLLFCPAHHQIAVFAISCNSRCFPYLSLNLKPAIQVVYVVELLDSHTIVIVDSWRFLVLMTSGLSTKRCIWKQNSYGPGTRCWCCAGQAPFSTRKHAACHGPPKLSCLAHELWSFMIENSTFWSTRINSTGNSYSTRIRTTVAMYQLMASSSRWNDKHGSCYKNVFITSYYFQFLFLNLSPVILPNGVWCMRWLTTISCANRWAHAFARRALQHVCVNLAIVLALYHPKTPWSSSEPQCNYVYTCLCVYLFSPVYFQNII